MSIVDHYPLFKMSPRGRGIEWIRIGRAEFLRRKFTMTMDSKKLFFPVSLWILMIILFTSSAIHAEDKAIQWQETFVTVDSDIRPVEGQEGHALGVMQQRGFAFYENGEIASVDVLLTFERRGGVTQYTGYAIYDFGDGTTKVGRFEGRGDPAGEQAGEFTFESGTGRYAGIQGDGTFTGTGYPPHGDIVLKVRGSYSLADSQ